MARQVRSGAATARDTEPVRPVAGSVRSCAAQRGELWRHRVITAADGLDYLVATTDERHRKQGYVTACFPVASGYLVMYRQPLCALPSADEAEASERHTLLLTVLAEGGTRVVRARRNLAAWRRAERRVDVSRPRATQTAPAASDESPEPVATEALGAPRDAAIAL